MRRHSDEDGLRASTASTAFLTAASHQSPTQVAEGPLSLLFTWGDGHGGALGHGGVRSEVSPRLCTHLLPFKLRTAACGGGYTLVALASGEVCSCGSGAGGVLGRGASGGMLMLGGGSHATLASAAVFVDARLVLSAMASRRLRGALWS